MPFRAPDRDHPLYGPAWREAAAGMLPLPQCDSCRTVLWPPTERCPECWAATITWHDLPGDGTIWSLAEYHRGYSPALADEVPYTCVLVELDCGPRMIARCVAPEGVAARPGGRVRTVRVAAADGQSVPVFAPVD